MRTLLPAFLLSLSLALAACGSESAPDHAAAPSAAMRLVDHDFPDAVGVLAAKETAVGEKVTVFGRVRAVADGVFTIVDDEDVDYCGHGKDKMSDCPTPWDYCCENPERVTAASLVVEATTNAGDPVPKAELGLRPVDLVALKGHLQKDEKGNLYLRADSGWHRRERPKLPDVVKFD